MPVIKPNPTPEDLVKAYDEGFEGWIWDEDSWEDLHNGEPSFESACSEIVGASSKVERVLLWKACEQFDPGAFGREPQKTGDCVSHGDRNAKDTSRSVEIVVHGEAEEYYKRGATEPQYGMRGHSGQGANPSTIAKFAKDYGFLVREKYELPSGKVLDLSKYNWRIGHDWGRNGTPDEVKELCAKYPVQKWVRPRTLDNVYDSIASGYALHSGQSWGCSRKASSDGIDRKSASWNHDMATVGYDRTKEVWRENVFFVPNSWGDFKDRNKLWTPDIEAVYGPWIKGMIVVPEDEYDRYFVRSGSIHAYGNIKGFPLQDLPDFGFGYV